MLRHMRYIECSGSPRQGYLRMEEVMFTSESVCAENRVLEVLDGNKNRALLPCLQGAQTGMTEREITRGTVQ